MSTSTDLLTPLSWDRGVLRMLDQLLLPNQEVWIECRTEEEVARAIRDMQVRGAPAIGCAAAYGIALAAGQMAARDPAPAAAELRAGLERATELLAATRPTAVNLFWALGQMRAAAEPLLAAGDARALSAALATRAQEIQEEDIAMCRRIGAYGAELVPDGAVILTHCNAGALATGGYGTALGVVRAAREAGKRPRVLADETRPYLQGARLTAWELERDGIDVTVIPDSAAAFLLRRGEASCVVVGADRIAANGDVANKIGTYGLALAASAAGVPFYVAAPRSTVDLATPTGDDIPIEERAGDELTRIGPLQVAPSGVAGRYPAFDVTPAALIAAIVTDAGVARPPFEETLRSLLRQ